MNNHQEEIHLLEAAILCLREDNPGACWRTADALGIMGKRWLDQIGINQPTGLGYKLKRSRPHDFTSMIEDCLADGGRA